nr:HalOD1 output domain-containing protein [Halovivax sp. KZCA124]
MPINSGYIQIALYEIEELVIGQWSQGDLVSDSLGERVELPPLGRVIDPDALNELFTGRSESTVAKVMFEYAGYDITVRGNGEVQARTTQDN